MSIWIFSNNRAGHYEDSDWDTSTILKHKRYYFKTSEPNRSKVAAGDRAILREYGRASGEFVRLRAIGRTTQRLNPNTKSRPVGSQ